MTTKWTDEMRWGAIAQAAVILGIVPDFSKDSMLKVSDMLKAREEQQLVKNRKEGEHQGAPSWYQAKFEE
ncbi:MAG: hypothetical protein WAO08_31215 [Hyphomicrobiaceae bacterium]|jgi:hypothetical protein